jgi:hypothetical protein
MRRLNFKALCPLFDFSPHAPLSIHFAAHFDPCSLLDSSFYSLIRITMIFFTLKRSTVAAILPTSGLARHSVQRASQHVATKQFGHLAASPLECANYRPEEQKRQEFFIKNRRCELSQKNCYRKLGGEVGKRDR